jgi:hypothetical protein
MRARILNFRRHLSMDPFDMTACGPAQPDQRQWIWSGFTIEGASHDE